MSTKSLSDQLLQELEVRKDSKSEFDGKEFLPEGCLDDLITYESVLRELGLKEQDMRKGSDEEGLVDFILKPPGAKKVFATLMFCGFTEIDLRMAISQFKSINFQDTSLPITEKTKRDIPFFEPTIVNPWRSMKIRHFCDYQWTFLAPVFSNNSLDLDLQPRHILPFIRATKNIDEGAFGDVHRVTIHESHQRDFMTTVRFPHRSF